MCLSNRAPPERHRSRLYLPQAPRCGLQPPFGQVTSIWQHKIIKCLNVCESSLFLISEVCVDKARIDEYEQRTSELAQKASCLTHLLTPVMIFTAALDITNPAR